MKEWYSARELTGKKGMPSTKSGVIRTAQNNKWPFREIDTRGGTRREYAASALPQETLDDLLSAKAGIAAPLPAPDALTSFLASHRISLSPGELADPLTIAKLECYRAWHACAYGEHRRILSALSTRHSHSPQQIRRWVDDIEQCKVPTRRAPRITIGTDPVELPRSSAFSPEALAYGIATYTADIKAGMRAAYRAMEQSAPERTWSLGDYASFTRILKKLPPALFTRIRRGQTGFELACAPKIIKEWTAVPVQTVLCGDQKVFDYVIYDPVTDTPIVPNGYFWEDCSSRSIVGVAIELGHYNSFTVGGALREALRFGIPEEIYTDWGKPEGAKHIAHIRTSLSAMASTDDFLAMQEKYRSFGVSPEQPASDAVSHRKAQAGKPWVKPIENIMNIIERRLTDKNLPGYRKRITADPWENKEMAALLKAQGKRGELMTPEAFISTVFQAVREHNEDKKQLKEGPTIIPWDFLRAGLQASPRTVLDETTLNYICLPVYIRTPNQSVVRIKVRHNDYRAYYSPALVRRTRPVQISIDPYDRDAPAHLADPDGSYLDLAQPWHAQDPYDQEGLREKIIRQKELMKWANEQSRRLRDGFGIAAAAASPSITRITPATRAAQTAASATKIYELRSHNSRLQAAEQTSEAKTLVAGLRAEFAANEERARRFTPPATNRERYRLWLTLSARKASGQGIPLLIEEEEFLENYRFTSEYQICAALHADFGAEYLEPIELPMETTAESRILS